MTLILAVISTTVSPLDTKAGQQTNSKEFGVKNEISKRADKIYENVEEVAEFPGGLNALMEWLGDNIRYPETAAQKDIQGRVIVKFIVECDGSIGNVTIAKGVDKDLDKEAVRVVRNMPKWKPGKNNGVPVRCYFNLPITFKLASDNTYEEYEARKKEEESLRFEKYGDDALKEGNESYAFSYYKEAFDIYPRHLYLIDSCCSLINKSEKYNDFLEWAVSRLLREVVNGSNFKEIQKILLDKAAQLQEIVVEQDNDIEKSRQLLVIYILQNNQQKGKEVLSKIYPQIPSERKYMLLQMYDLEAILSHNAKNFQDIENFPKSYVVNILKIKDTEFGSQAFLYMLDSYMNLGREKDVKSLLKKFKKKNIGRLQQINILIEKDPNSCNPALKEIISQYL